MEEQKLTEQESILLITEMISRTKRRKLDNGNIMLLWGYLSVAVATRLGPFGLYSQRCVELAVVTDMDSGWHVYPDKGQETTPRRGCIHLCGQHQQWSLVNDWLYGYNFHLYMPCFLLLWRQMLLEHNDCVCALGRGIRRSCAGNSRQDESLSDWRMCGNSIGIDCTRRHCRQRASLYRLGNAAFHSVFHLHDDNSRSYYQR